MGTPGLAGPATPPSAAYPSRAATQAKRPVMSQLTTRVTAPVGVLVFIWAVMTALTLGGAFGNPPALLAGLQASQRTTVETASIAGSALVIVVIALALTAAFVRQLAQETNDVAVAARNITDVRLPAELRALRAEGQGGPPTLTAGSVTDGSSTEISEVAAAIVGLHHAALSAATSEASLRNGLRQVLVSLGRRNQSLVHRQLRIIDKLEKAANGSTELSDLFTLDHLTTRMRRQAESLTVLAGEAPGRSWSSPVPVIDVMRAAAAEVEDYKRVAVRSDAEQSIAAGAVTDMIHLLAELIENATLFSPSSTKVEVRAESVANGFVIEVEDRGLGIPADQLREINARLANPPDEDLADADALGLYVAAKLAVRHGIHVSLNPSAYRGTKAVVVLPNTVVVATKPGAKRLTGGQAALGQTAVGQVTAAQEAAPSRLNLQAPGVLALAASDRARQPEPPRSEPPMASPSVFTPSVFNPSAMPSQGRGALPGSDSVPSDDSLSVWDALPGRSGPGPGGAPPTSEFPAATSGFPPVNDSYMTGGFPGSAAGGSTDYPRNSGLPSDSGLGGNVDFPGSSGFGGGTDYSANSGFPGDTDHSVNSSFPGDTDYPANSGSQESYDYFGNASSSRSASPSRNTSFPGSTGAFPGSTGSDPAKPGLPRRVRPDRSATPSRRQGPADAPVPDQARSLASSLQSSWRRSQQDDNFPGPRPGPGSEEAS
jgi:signal transduction histidine kinase